MMRKAKPASKEKTVATATTPPTTPRQGKLVVKKTVPSVVLQPRMAGSSASKQLHTSPHSPVTPVSAAKPKEEESKPTAAAQSFKLEFDPVQAAQSDGTANVHTPECNEVGARTNCFPTRTNTEEESLLCQDELTLDEMKTVSDSAPRDAPSPPPPRVITPSRAVLSACVAATPEKDRTVAAASTQQHTSEANSAVQETESPIQFLSIADDAASGERSGQEPQTPTSALLLPKTTTATRLSVDFKVGDLQHVIVKGHKYVFDSTSMRWKTYDVTLRILHPNRGVNQDNYFAIFAAELLDPVKSAAPMFVKVYRRNIADVAEPDYFSLAQAQALCEEFARDYTRHQGRSGYTKHRLPLLTNRVVVRLNMKSLTDRSLRKSKTGFFSYRTQDTHQMMFFMEPNTLACEAVGASFTSPEVDEGRCYSRGDPNWPRDVYGDIADGLSHFSLVHSRGKMVVHGFLRSNGYLLDPLFHTTDRTGFRMGDNGRKAIAEWVNRHRCGDTCRALGLPQLTGDVAASFSRRQANPLAREENHYTEYLYAVRNMRVVMRVAADAMEDGDETTDDMESTDRQSLMAVSESNISVTGVVPASPTASMNSAVTVEAIKYFILPSREQWTAVPTRVRVPHPASPATADDRSAIFALEELSDTNAVTPMRARFILKGGAKDADYYDVGAAYCACVTLGQLFRERRPPGVFLRELDFRSAYAVRIAKESIPDALRVHLSRRHFFSHTTQDSGDVMFILEPHYTPPVPLPMPGSEMEKDTEGYDDRDLRQAVDTFSHFTYQRTDHYLLICHLKCKDGLLMRPHLDTSDGKGFGMMNSGATGMQHWARRHKCNALCKAFDLAPISTPVELGQEPTTPLMAQLRLHREEPNVTGGAPGLAIPSTPPPPSVSLVKQPPQLTEVASHADVNEDPIPVMKLPSRVGNGASASSEPVSPLSAPSLLSAGPEEPLLRPWVHTNRAGLPHVHRRRGGVAASGPRRPLTQGELNLLHARDMDTTFLFPSTKYVYDIASQTWTMRRTFVRIVTPDRGLSQGGMRVCFDVMEVDPSTGEEVMMVAKMFRRNIKDVVEKDYFTEVSVQRLTALFVADFNAEPSNAGGVRLNVLEGAVMTIELPDLTPEQQAKRTGFFSYRTTDTQRLMFSVEARLIGRFTKYNGNMGEAYPTNETRLPPDGVRERLRYFEAVEALSHYSLLRSQGGLLACDMQGVKGDLTDLEIHTYDGQGLGIGNFGSRGIEKFMERHRCTDVCAAMHLETLKDRAKFVVTDEVREINRFVRIFERSKEIDQMPE